MKSDTRRRNDLERAMEAARRFLEEGGNCVRSGKDLAWGGREWAAMKRASMDLTMALPPLRRPMRWGDPE